jgi:hypothetical protein
VGQSAEEALNSLVEEMKEMLAAPVYDLTPLQDVSEKFWSAMAEARRQNARREERLEQSLAKIKAESLMAREEHEEQLSAERDGADALRRRLRDATAAASAAGRPANASSAGESGATTSDEGGGGLHALYTPKRDRSSASSSYLRPSPGGSATTDGVSFGGGGAAAGSGRAAGTGPPRGGRGGRQSRGGAGSISSGQSVVSLGSEFASRAKNLVHLMNCQGGDGEGGGWRGGVVGGRDDRNGRGGDFDARRL